MYDVFIETKSIPLMLQKKTNSWNWNKNADKKLKKNWKKLQKSD